MSLLNINLTSFYSFLSANLTFHFLISVAIGIIGVGFLIGFHELGHFIFCKLFKVSTPSFSIGMGPRLISKKIGETEFSISAIPLGGYVEVAGMAEVGQGEQKEAYRTDQYSLISKPYYQKMLIMAGGILFNIFFGWIALSLLYFLGMPETPLLYPLHASTTISFIKPDSPAEKAGLQVHDKITAIDQQPVSDATQVTNAYKDKMNQTVAFAIERNNQSYLIPVDIISQEQGNNNVGFLGARFEIPPYPLLASFKYGLEATWIIIYQVGAAIKGIFTQRKIDNMGGPLMVIAETIKGASKGFKIFLLLLAFISINLAILNIIPLPVFDGGQALYYTIEAITKRPVSDKVREYIHYATWILILCLALYLTYKDIMRLFWPKS